MASKLFELVNCTASQLWHRRPPPCCHRAVCVPSSILSRNSALFCRPKQLVGRLSWLGSCPLVLGLNAVYLSADWWGGFQWLIRRVLSCARPHTHTHTHTHSAAQALHCGRNEGLGTFHAGHSERTSVAVLAWLSESNVVTPSTASLRVGFSSVPPSVPSLRSVKVPEALLLHVGNVVPPLHF